MNSASGRARRLRLVLSACGLVAVGALAQSYPSKPVRLVVGFSPGGAADVTARLIGQKLTEDLGQSFIIENRTGASGLIANSRVAASPPDGYTLVLVSSAAAIMPALRTKMPYDVERDLAPVALVVKSAHILLTHPSLPVHSVKELIAFARARPDKLSYGHSGFGSANHMAGELFNLMAKTRIKHVPYKGGAENVTAAISGETELTFGSLAASVPFINGGKLRALGITGTKRSPLIPNVPTISEAGLPGYDSTAWYGILAPAAVPKAIIAQLNTAIVKDGQSPELHAAFTKQGLDPQTYTPEQFGEYIHSEIAKNVNLVKSAGLTTEKP
jgi:tripartite-type tricarboxylate transporter receptor subunit TctC